MNKYKNIFCFYKPPSSQKNTRNDIIQSSSQIENNITKSLIIVLEKTDSQQIWNAFFSLLNEKQFPKNKTLFCLQSIPEMAKHAKNGYVLFITNDKDARVSDKEKGPKGGRPDAWIYSQTKSFAIMIEAKVDTPVYEKQLFGHLKSCGWEKKTPKIIKWSDIHKKFSCIKVKSDKDKFLLKEFIEYLEITDLSTFVGWREDHFETFKNIQNAPDRERRRRVQNYLMQYLLEVKEKVISNCIYKKLEVHTGKLGKQSDECWGILYDPSLGKKYSLIPHFNFLITSKEFMVGVQIEDPKLACRVMQQIKEKQKQFLSICQRLEGYHLILRKKNNRPNNSYKHDYPEIKRIPLGKNFGLHAIEGKLPKDKKFTLTFSKIYDRNNNKELKQMQRDKFLQDSADVLCCLKKLYEFTLNGIRR